MNPVFKLYLKMFLLTGIPYGSIIVGFDMIDGSGFRLWKLLGLIFCFGLAMSLTMVSFHIYGLKKKGVNDFTKENLAVTQSRSIKSKLNLKQVKDKLTLDSDFMKMRFQELDNGIQISSPANWMSWGEKIQIILSGQSGDAWEYHVSSKPLISTALVDSGKNLDNINRVQHAIQGKF
jgi:hypothetical protein